MGRHIGEIVGGTKKVCTKCEEVKQLSEFRKQGNGVSSACKECLSKKDKEYKARNSDKIKKYRDEWKKNPASRNVLLNSRLKKIYGITAEEYELMLNDQNGLCAICGKQEKAGNQYQEVKRLAVDHCHKTGNIRGLLCTNCNTRLATLEDEVYVKSAMKYLAKYES